MGKKDGGKVRGKVERGISGHQNEESRRKKAKRKKETERKKAKEIEEELRSWQRIQQIIPESKRYEWEAEDDEEV